MAVGQDSEDGENAVNGKYLKLHTRLRAIWSKEWKTSFAEIEVIIGSNLPPSARRGRTWWGSEKTRGRNSQARAWIDAGWEMAEVDVEAETVLFRRTHKFDFNDVWPVHHAGGWPKGLSLRREGMYEDRV